MKFENVLYVGLLGFILLVCLAVLRSFLESKRVDKKLTYWNQWLSEKPNVQEYLRKNNQSDPMSCFFCGEIRILQSLEMVTVANFKHGFFENKSNGYLYWRSYNCTKCQTVLCREVEERLV